MKASSTHRPISVRPPWISLLLLLVLCSSSSPASAQCPGDCNGDGQVTVDELVAGVHVALTGFGGCDSLDADGNAEVTVDELLTAIQYALLGCPGPAAPAPALISSSPAPEDSFAHFEWLRLDFAADVAPAALSGFSVTCAGVRRLASVYLARPQTVIINPVRDLPPASACTIDWTGPEGPERIEFDTAAAGDAGEVVYDRTNARLTHPFPDDFFLAPAPERPNGVALSIPVPSGPTDLTGIFRVLLPGTRVLDGFSPIAHFTIELSEAPDPQSLPRTPAQSLDPMAAIALFDVTAGSSSFGQRVPFRTDVRDDTNVAGVRTHTLLFFPSISLSPGGRYALVVTRRVRTSSGAPFEPSAFLAAALSEPRPDEQDAVARVRELALSALAGVRSDPSQPLQADDVALVVRATIRTVDEIPSDLLAIREQVFAADPPAFTITEVRPESDPRLAATVIGTWEAPDWRDGHFFRRDAEGRPVQTKTNTVPFILVLPRSALEAPVPLTMYQHGNPGSAQREVPNEARDYLADAGFAVIGFTDNLNRELSPGNPSQEEAIRAQITGIFFDLLSNRKIPDYWVQLNGEQIAFLRLMQSLSSLDVLPAGDPDGVPELDLGEPLTYVGISQGANYASGFLPYVPEIGAAAVVVGGARLAEVLIHQQPGAFLNELGGFYPSMTAADIWVALALFQTIYDNQDEHNHARYMYREPLTVAGTSRKASVLMIEGLDDSLVPNHATDSLAWTMGPIPHLLPIQRAVPFLDTVTGPVTANIDESTTAAFYQYVPVGIEGIDPTPGCAVLGPTSAREGHYCAQSAAESERQRTVFFRTLLDDGVPTIIDPLSE